MTAMKVRVLILTFMIFLFLLLYSLSAGAYFSYISWENRLGLSLGLGFSSGLKFTDTELIPTTRQRKQLDIGESFSLDWVFYSEEDMITYKTAWSYDKESVRLGSAVLDLRRENNDYLLKINTAWDPADLAKMTTGLIQLRRQSAWTLSYGDKMSYSDLSFPSSQYLGVKYEDTNYTWTNYQLVRGKYLNSANPYFYGAKIIVRDPRNYNKFSLGLSFITVEDANNLVADQVFTYKGVYTPIETLTFSTDYIKTLGGDKVFLSSYNEWFGRSYYSIFHKFSMNTNYYYADDGYTLDSGGTSGHSLFFKYRTFDVFHYINDWIAGYEYVDSKVSYQDTVDRGINHNYSLTSAWNIQDWPQLNFGTKYSTYKTVLTTTTNIQEMSIYGGASYSFDNNTYISTQWSQKNKWDTGLNTTATDNRKIDELLVNSFGTRIFDGSFTFSHLNSTDIIDSRHENKTELRYNRYQSLWGDIIFQTNSNYSAVRDDHNTVDSTTMGLNFSLSRRFESYGKTSIEYNIYSYRDAIDSQQDVYSSEIVYSALFSFDLFSLGLGRWGQNYSERYQNLLKTKWWIFEDLQSKDVAANQIFVNGIVFHDLNGNKLLDKGEPPVKDVAVRLAGYEYGQIYTNSMGYYDFRVNQPIEQNFNIWLDTRTLPISMVGTDKSNVVLKADRNKRTFILNLPVISTQRISGVIYDDVNRNGVLDPDEEGLSDIYVLLDNGEQISYSDEQGHYTMSGIGTGVHSLEIKPTRISEKWVSTTGMIKTVNVAFNEEAKSNNFGFYEKEKPTRQIRRKVF